MAVAHHQNVRGHGFMNYSTPSLPGTLSSTYRGSCISTRMFSSPLAECYAGDAGLGSSSHHRRRCGYHEPSGAASPPGPDSRFGYKKDDESSKSFLNLSSSKNSLVQNSPNPHPSKLGTEGHPSSNCRRALFDAPKHVALDDQPIPSAPRSPYATKRKIVHKPLLSPISFTPPTDASDASDSIGKSSYELERHDEPTTCPPLKYAAENRCAFPPYETHTLFNERRDAANKASRVSPRSHVSTRRRSLSLGEEHPSNSPWQQKVDSGVDGDLLGSRCAMAGSRELRRSAGSLSLKKDCAPWVDQIVEATKRAGSYQPYRSLIVDSKQLHDKPRLWLDATSREQGIAEAVCCHLRLPE